MRELSLNILDIAQNSISAGASLITIDVSESREEHLLTLTVSDNGCGMDEEQLQNVCDPFFTTRTTRKVGMGIPLFRLAAEQTGGSFEITSKKGVGTSTKAVFHSDSIDFTPLQGVLPPAARPTKKNSCSTRGKLKISSTACRLTIRMLCSG